MTELTFLGTGTSQGVPIIACQCRVCRSTDPRDKRFRSSALIRHNGLTILVDAGPDFRSQMLAHDVRHLDAILITHAHKDHTGGLDDVRSFNYIDRKAAEIYCEPRVLEALKNDKGIVPSDNESIAKTADYVVLAVKPQVLPSVLPPLKEAFAANE